MDLLQKVDVASDIDRRRRRSLSSSVVVVGGGSRHRCQRSSLWVVVIGGGRRVLGRPSAPDDVICVFIAVVVPGDVVPPRASNTADTRVQSCDFRG